MRRHFQKTAPRVVRGTVQRKNRCAPTPTYANTLQPEPVIDRLKPGRGYRHLLRKEDIRRFVRLLPDWDELSVGLHAIIFAPGEAHCDGWYEDGIVALCAWDRSLWRDVHRDHWREHRAILELLGVPCTKLPDGYIRCQWTEPTARAYQLTHILLHELGHHDDRMRTHNRAPCARGEPYAESYALRYADRIWEQYLREFGLP